MSAIVHEAREKFREIRNPQELLANDDGADVERVLQAGVRQGLKVYLEHLEQNCRESVSVLQRLT